MGVNRTAELHGIPKTTLKDRVNGRVAHGSKSGPRSCLTRQEETQLAEYLLVSYVCLNICCTDFSIHYNSKYQWKLYEVQLACIHEVCCASC